ncbi:hypothetical protein FJZ53_06455 [Candidatus Woesearchaeota archaeon]|nr:hypothetical protein [Candidatus Woesearchaeota archaeon]
MKQEYFAQVGIHEKVSEEPMLSKLEQMLEIKPILEEGVYAVSRCEGIGSGSLCLSPFEGTVEGGTEHGKKYKSYMFRITDLVSKLGLTDLETIRLKMKEKIKPIGEAKLFAVYDVTATDVPADYKIIQKIPLR